MWLQDSECCVAVITAETFKLNFVSGDLTLVFSDTGKTTVSIRKRKKSLSAVRGTWVNLSVL